LTTLPALLQLKLTLKKQGIIVPDLDALENILAYQFKNRSLLERAITHRSWAHEQVAPGAGGPGSSTS
jgi:hypothetical protein